jgi:phosphoglycerate dehydrogenase-like enzyme
MKIKFLNKPTKEFEKGIELLGITTTTTLDCDIIYTHMNSFCIPEAFPNLKFVVCPQTDISHLPEFDKIIFLDDKDFLAKNVWSTAEHTLSLLLQLSKIMNQEIRGKQICILGSRGRVGTQLRFLLNGFDCEILGIDKHNLHKMKYYFSIADIITIHINNTEDNSNFINGEKLGFIKNNKPLIINTSRSNVLNADDLLKSLKKEKVKGFALDVTESYTKKQKKEFNILVSENRGLITNHISGKSNESRVLTDMYCLEKLRKEIMEL